MAVSAAMAALASQAALAALAVQAALAKLAELAARSNGATQKARLAGCRICKYFYRFFNCEIGKKIVKSVKVAKID